MKKKLLDLLAGMILGAVSCFVCWYFYQVLQVPVARMLLAFVVACIVVVLALFWAVQRLFPEKPARTQV